MQLVGRCGTGDVDYFFIAPPGATSIAAIASPATNPAPNVLHRPSGGDLHCSKQEIIDTYQGTSLHRPSGGDLHCSSVNPPSPSGVAISSSPLRGRPPLQLCVDDPTADHSRRLHRPSGGDLHCSDVIDERRPVAADLHRPSGGDLHCSPAGPCTPSPTSGAASSPLRGRPPLQPLSRGTVQRALALHRPSGGDLHCSAFAVARAAVPVGGFIAPPGATSIAALSSHDRRRVSRAS